MKMNGKKGDILFEFSFVLFFLSNEVAKHVKIFL